MDTILAPGSMYSIDNPLTFHSVQPMNGYRRSNENNPSVFDKFPLSAWTVMINGKPWDADTAHTDVRTTQGKDLGKLTPYQMGHHLLAFKELLAIRLQMP